MKAILIATNDAVREAVCEALEDEGHAVASVLRRPAGAGLSRFLDGLAPELLIVESPAEQFDADVAALSTLIVSHAGVAVLMLSEQHQPEALVAALRAGVGEVLPSPPRADQLVEALRRTVLRHQAEEVDHNRHGRVIGFTSTKPGSGATFLATNLAYLLATEFDARVLLIDLDLEFGDASYFMGDEADAENLASVTQQADRLDVKLLAASTRRLAPNLHLLAAPADPEEALGIDASSFSRLLDVACLNYDFVMIDIVRTPDPAVGVKAIDKADTIFVVLQNLVPYLRDARRSLRILNLLDFPKDKLRIVVNRYERQSEIDLGQIRKAIGSDVDYMVPNSTADTMASLNTGVPLAKVNPRNPIVRALREMAGDLAERSARVERGWLGRLFGARA